MVDIITDASTKRVNARVSGLWTQQKRRPILGLTSSTTTRIMNRPQKDKRIENISHVGAINIQPRLALPSHQEADITFQSSMPQYPKPMNPMAQTKNTNALA
jgi:hypothetical protein